MKRILLSATMMVLLAILAVACKKSAATTEGDPNPVLLRLEVVHNSGDTSYSRIYVVP